MSHKSWRGSHAHCYTLVLTGKCTPPIWVFSFVEEVPFGGWGRILETESTSTLSRKLRGGWVLIRNTRLERARYELWIGTMALQNGDGWIDCLTLIDTQLALGIDTSTVQPTHLDWQTMTGLELLGCRSYTNCSRVVEKSIISDVWYNCASWPLN